MDRGSKIALIALVVSLLSLGLSAFLGFRYGPQRAEKIAKEQIEASREIADEQMQEQRNLAKETAATAEPSVLLSYNQDAEVPEESCALETCRYMRVELISFYLADQYRYACWTEDLGQYHHGTFNTRVANDLCPFGDVGERVRILVDGHWSNALEWNPPDRDLDGPLPETSRTVGLGIGDSAEDAEDCQSSECSYLKITLKNFEAGEHSLDCILLDTASQTTSRLQPQKQFSGQESVQDCWYDGHQGIVWAVVDGIESNRLEIERPVSVSPTEDTLVNDVTVPSTDLARLEPPELSPSWNGGSWVVLSWLPHEPDAVGDAGTPEEFEVEYRSSSAEEWTASTSTTRYGNGHNVYVYEYYHRIEDLNRLTDYEARVRQCSDSDCSAWATHLFRTERPIPPPPAEVRVLDVGTDYFILEWDEVPGAYIYDVYYVGGDSITTGGSRSAIYESPFPLEPGTEYEVTVNSCNDLQRHGDYGAQACGELDQGTVIRVTTER